MAGFLVNLNHAAGDPVRNGIISGTVWLFHWYQDFRQLPVGDPGPSHNKPDLLTGLVVLDRRDEPVE